VPNVLHDRECPAVLKKPSKIVSNVTIEVTSQQLEITIGCANTQPLNTQISVRMFHHLQVPNVLHSRGFPAIFKQPSKIISYVTIEVTCLELERLEIILGCANTQPLNA